MRRAARRDDNHGEIVSALRQIGCFVEDLAGVGNGCPDLLVGFAGSLSLLEVKDGSKPPCERGLTPDQVKWHARASFHRLPVHVVDSVDAAIAAVRWQRMPA